MVYTRKTKLFNLPGADIITLTHHLDVAPDTRGWRKVIQFLQLNMGEVRRCELGGGAGPLVELMCQRGWNIGKVLDMLEKVGNQAAISSLLEIIGDNTPAPVSAPAQIEGNCEPLLGSKLKLKVCAPKTYTDVQWYFEKTCLPAEKSRELIVEEVSAENSGRYKVRLQAHPSDVRWVFADVIVTETPGSPVEELKFVLQPQDYLIKEPGSAAHFFVDVRPYCASLQWYCEGVLMHDKIQPYLCVTDLDETAHRRQYKCVAEHGNKSVTSEAALVRWTPDTPKDFTGSGFVETATDKVALIIGNQSYHEATFGDIVHAEDDARDIGAALKLMQFKVVSLINLTRDEMLAACDNFYKLLSSGVYGVFYFAGHGFESGGDNYLVPVDAPSTVRVEHCIKAQYVLHRMQFRDTKLNLLLLDMCREFANVGGIPGDMQPVRSRGNTAIGFACGPGSRAYGSENDKNGIYVTYLKEHINRNITVTNLLDCVNKAIGMREPSGYQRPHYQSSIIKNISLNDPIDTTNHTAEFHHRYDIWRMANNVDKETEEVTLKKTLLLLHYVAGFSNVLQFSVTGDFMVDRVEMDQDSTNNGLLLLKLSDTQYEIRNIQKLRGAVIELTFYVANDIATVRIERPLFAKITANRVNFGTVMDVELAGTHRTGMCQVPSRGNRGCSAEERAKKKAADMNQFDHKTEDNDKKAKEKAEAKKRAELKQQTEKEETTKLPKPLENHDNRVVYPFVGIYLYPHPSVNKDADLEVAVEKIKHEAEETYREKQLSLVTMETNIVNRHSTQPWIEVILRDKEHTTKSLLEGKSWNGSTVNFSCHMGSLLNMVYNLAVNTDISEMWVTDREKFRQVVPQSSDLVIDVNPTSLPIA